MPDNSSSNTRIAKNTLLLYLRQFLILAISLYTSRVVLDTLGVSDYGIYNVVGSVVTMFVFIRSAMGNATNRYIAYAIGKGEENNLKRIFSTCLYVHFILAFIIVLLSEIAGLWLLYNKLEIPPDRMTAAFWVLQFSIITCAIGVLCVPYDAEIIAHEKMEAFAYLSILDVTMKLLLVFLLKIISSDKLIFYGLFLLLVQLMNRFIYSTYCWKKFPETRHANQKDLALIKEMFGFAGWNIMGNMAAFICAPIINVFINIFFGPILNAARGIAVQVQGAVKSFISNFQLAVIPQITKTYATGDLERMRTLIISSSKISFYLFYIIALPLSVEAKQILSIWLVEVPDHTVSFMRLVLIVLLVESWEQPLHTANLATGKIRLFQTAKGFSLLLMLPISFFALKMGAQPEIVFIIQLLVTFFSLLIQLFIIRPLISLSLRQYYLTVFCRTIIVSIIASAIPLLLYYLLNDNLFTMLVVVMLCFISSITSIYLIGLNYQEKLFVKNTINNYIRKILVK